MKMHPSISGAEPLASLLARGVKDKRDLTKKAGGLLSVVQVARILGISQQEVHKQLHAKKLLAVRQRGKDKFPAIQFAANGVVPGLPKVLQAVGLEGPWSVLDFLLTPADDLQALSPIEALKTRPDLRETVIDAARAEGRHGA